MSRPRAAADEPLPPERTALRELCLLFAKLGATAFGGPAAHIALMEQEVVRRRRWLSHARFLDLLGATNLIPGPNSTELALHIGFERRGLLGLLVAGSSFILPPLALTGALGWLYVRYGALPQAAWLLYGVKPVMLAVVLQAIWGLTPQAARSWPLRALGVLALLLGALGVHELMVLLGCGVLSALGARWGRGSGSLAALPPLLPALPLLGAAGASVTLPGLFWVFFKIGSVLFGSGYVLLAFLRADLVERLGWLSEAQLLDSVVVGQVTPGPVFTTATFIGYLLAGPAGALVATSGIFLPAFILVALSGPLVPRLRASALAGAVLDGVNVASLALMIVVTLQLGRAALVDLPSVLAAALSGWLLLRFGTNATWLILGGAVLGALVRGLDGL